MRRVGESAVVFNLECKHDCAKSQRNHCTWKMFDKSAAFPFWTLRHDTSLLWTLPLPSQHMMPNCSSVWFTPSLSYQHWTGHGASLLPHSFCLFLSSALNAMMTIVTNRTPRQKLPLAAKCQPPTRAYFFFFCPPFSPASCLTRRPGSSTAHAQARCARPVMGAAHPDLCHTISFPLLC